MSENITILEGGKAENFGQIARLRTDDGNILCSYTLGNISWSNNVENMDFFAPYQTSVNYYEDSPIEKRRLFWNALQATK